MLSQRMQCNLLYRYFVMREPVTIDPNALVEPWRQIFLLAEREEREYWVIEGYDPLRSAAITIANKDRDLAQRWIDAIYASAEPISFPTLAEMADALAQAAGRTPPREDEGGSEVTATLTMTALPVFHLVLAVLTAAAARILFIRNSLRLSAPTTAGAPVPANIGPCPMRD